MTPIVRSLVALRAPARAALLLSPLSLLAAAQEPVPASFPAPAPAEPSPMPCAVSSFGAAELDGWIYLTGGHSGRTHRYSEESQWKGFVRLRAADPAVREELPGGEGLQGTALVAAGGRLVRVGGLRARGSGADVELRSVADVSAFDPATRAWSELPALPAPRSSHDAIAIGTRVFVFGGWDLTNGDTDAAQWAEHGLVLDLAEIDAGWRELPQPFVQRGVALAASEREVFVLGGMDEEGEFSSAVDVFDPATGAWRRAQPYPGEGFGLSAVVEGERLFVSGRTGDVWSLALDGADGGRWEACGQLFVPRLFHRMLADADGLVVLGGTNASNPVGWIERVRPDEPRNAALFTLPFPGRARQRQALFADGSTLYLFGGNVALEQHDFEPESFLAESWSFALGEGSHVRLPDLPHGRQSMVCAAAPDGESVYALGGFGHDGDGDRAFDEIWRWSLDEHEAWTVLDARLPHRMTQFRALLHGEELLLVGGMDFDRERGQKMQLLDTVYTASAARLEDGFQEAGLRLPSPRRAFGAAIVGEKLYVAGGLEESFSANASFDVYDFTTRAWSRLPSPATARLSPELVALGGKLYLCAGLVFDAEGRTLPAERVEEFDPARGAWRTLSTPLPLDPHEVQAFTWSDRLAFVSTWNERGVLELALLDPRLAPAAH